MENKIEKQIRKNIYLPTIVSGILFLFVMIVRNSATDNPMFGTANDLVAGFLSGGLLVTSLYLIVSVGKHLTK